MCTGRCVCGYTAHTGDVEAHQVGCAQFAVAYRADPDQVRSPGDEYDLWLEAGKKAERAAVHAASVADTDARRAVMASRFATRDILED